MSDLVHQLAIDLGPRIATHLNNTLGIDPETSGRLFKQVTPLILGGLEKQLRHQGLEHVNQTLTKYAEARADNDIAERFHAIANDHRADPGLDGLLGDSGLIASKLFAEHFALDANDARKIIPMMAPVVLATLAGMRDVDGPEAADVAALIQEHGDGRILEDVPGFLRKGLAKPKKNRLTGLLGQLLMGTSR